MAPMTPQIPQMEPPMAPMRAADDADAVLGRGRQRGYQQVVAFRKLLAERRQCDLS
jgi:hypothetical protein